MAKNQNQTPDPRLVKRLADKFGDMWTADVIHTHNREQYGDQAAGRIWDAARKIAEGR